MKTEINIPNGVDVKSEMGLVSVSMGSKVNAKLLDNPRVRVSVSDSSILIECVKDTRGAKRLVNTYRAHILNLLKGLDNEFVYKLKVCSTHFPMDVSVHGNLVVIKNFLGEHNPRKAKICDGTTVEVAGEDITVKSNNKESAGMTASSIEHATHLSFHDKRRFQDGIYMTVKAGKPI